VRKTRGGEEHCQDLPVFSLPPTLRAVAFSPNGDSPPDFNDIRQYCARQRCYYGALN
jgi:hypothetical protein